MKDYTQAVTTYVTAHKKEFLTGLGAILGLAVLVALFVYNNPPTVVYQPVNACDLLTPAKAQDLLGNKVISIDTQGAVISGDVATSKCSYTDSNPDQNRMAVAAIAVRSAVNDKGIAENKTDFASARPTTNVETVKSVGDSAYFNHTRGQLNVLDGHNWIILSYGIGSDLAASTPDKVIALAGRVLR